MSPAFRRCVKDYFSTRSSLGDINGAFGRNEKIPLKFKYCSLCARLAQVVRARH